MPRFRRRQTTVDAHQWFANGDHPDDYATDRPILMVDEATDPPTKVVVGTLPAAQAKAEGWEGAVVRYFRRPGFGGIACRQCGRLMHDHGWIETLEGGYIVCPGDWIVTGTVGERYPVKPDIFSSLYELVCD